MRAFLFIAFCFCPVLLIAQELPVYNEYHLNKTLINPAITGSEECALFRCTDRHQWTGIDGAPQIQTLTAEYGISNKRVLREFERRTHGIGALVFRDKNGANRNLGVQASYAYHFYVSRLYGIRLGLGAAFQYFQWSLSESGFIGDPDPTVTGGTQSYFAPDLSAGAFLYNTKWFAGLSATRLLNFMAGSSPRTRNYFLIAGYLTGRRDDRIRFLPSAVIKLNDDLNRQIDLNAKMLVDDRWWAGLSYRHNFDKLPGQPVSIIPMMGASFGNFFFTYALDITPNRLQLHSYGTHEIMIGYKWCIDGYRCPVYR
jgi:type IX secretion system PorP/SprF family membrane protein